MVTGKFALQNGFTHANILPVNFGKQDGMECLHWLINKSKANVIKI